jgi:mannose-1-phosphate guanylyltransferase
VKAVLLAAGIGSRLGALTEATPKCLLPIQGRPLLDYWFGALHDAGVRELFINLHHLKDQVEDYLAGQTHGMQVTTLYEPVLLGSAGTLRAATEFVGDDEEFFIIYADNFALIDLKKLLRFHRAKQQPVLSLLSYRTDYAKQCGILELDDDDRVISFEEKPEFPRSNIANSGIHVASPELFDFLPATNPADIGFDVLPRLIGKMYGYVTDEFIQDIGTLEAYEAVQKMKL